MVKCVALIVNRLKRKRKINYYSYIRSRTWKKKADRIREQRNFICEKCGKRGWQVHHKSYEHLGRERDYELALLCDDCHRIVTRENKN